MPASVELPFRQKILLHKDRSSPMAPFGTISCFQRLQSHIQCLDCYLPHLYISLVQLPPLRSPTQSRSVPFGVAFLTLLFHLWLCPSICDGPQACHLSLVSGFLFSWQKEVIKMQIKNFQRLHRVDPIFFKDLLFFFAKEMNVVLHATKQFPSYFPFSILFCQGIL